MSLNILAVSDVSLGFGSTQIPEFMKFILCEYKGGKGLVIEPDQPDKPYIRDRYKEFLITRIVTHTNVYSNTGRIEFLKLATELINREEPDVLVVFTTFTLPVLFKIKKRPKMVIYYNIEMASNYWNQDMILNKNLGKMVDLLIYPEENRAMLDINKFGDRNIPSIVVYNCSNDSDTSCILPSDMRNGKFIYQGTLDIDNTHAGYFMGEAIKDIYIDIFGNFSGAKKEQLQDGFTQLNERIRYYGYVENAVIKEIRKNYSFSIVMWVPNNENQYYAAPNKFFESISDGVIPICTPHPQCKLIIEKYDCGILIPDWSFESFEDILKSALKLRKTKKYDEMIENCKTAVKTEMNWQAQMNKVRPFLKSL